MSLQRRRSRNPVESGLYLAAVGRVTAFGGRIVGASDFHDLAALILHNLCARDEIGITKAHFATRCQAEEFLRRILHEVVALDPQFPTKRDLASSRRRILGVVHTLQMLNVTFRVVLDDHLQRIQNTHKTGRHLVEMVAHIILQQRHFHIVLAFRHAHLSPETTNGLGWHTATAHALQGGQSRIVPIANQALLDKLEQSTFAGHGVGDVPASVFDLPRWEDPQLLDIPVVQRAMVLELQRAQRVGHALDRVALAMGPVVHRIDAPFICSAMVCRSQNPIHHRIAQIHIRGRHIDLGS